MEKYVAVDSGKFATKVALYDKDNNKTLKFRFHTKIGDGNFKDDALEASTFIAEVAGKVYKIGAGASTSAELETSKKSIIHQISTLVALAMCASENEVDEFHVAIGMPVKEYDIVEKRIEYRDYILPDGEITVKLKCNNDKPVVEKIFKIVDKKVYPESGGALYLDASKFVDNTAAIIDIGNLNINCTLWQNFDIIKESSLTDELGGDILIRGLAQKLTAEFSRCDEHYILKVLSQSKENRYLRPNRSNKEVEERSAVVIHDYLVDHVKKIKRGCDAKQWSLDYMDIICIGGTSSLIKDELREVFGEEIVIPNEPEYVNVVGFLTRLCAKKLNIEVPKAESYKM